MRPAWIWAAAGAGAVVVLGGVAVATAPEWLRPLLASRATAALGRAVSIDRLEIRTWRPPVVVLHGVRIASPRELAQRAPNLATVQQVALTLDLRPVWQGRPPDVPQAALTGLRVTAVETPEGATNYVFPTKAGSGSRLPRVGMVRVQDGAVELNLPRHQVEAQVALATEADGTMVADLQGRYAGQPVTGNLRGAPIANLAEGALPYAIEARLESGAARLVATGSIAGPLQPPAARLNVELAGTNMQRLQALTGIPFPPTPPFTLAGATTFEGGVARLDGLQGTLGSTDLHGHLVLDMRGERPVVAGEIASARVDLQDLAGLIGSQPGRATTPGLTPAQRQAIAQAEASPRLIPNLPMDLPKLQAADFHIAYRGEKIIGKWLPFDSVTSRLDIEDGHIGVTGLRVAVGRGALATRTLLLDSEDDRTTVQRSVDMRSETINAVLRTRAKHFTIGTLATPIQISGTLKNPRFAPDRGELAARGAAAVGLGLLLAPAALLPTIQLGIGEDNACAAIAREPASRAAQ